MAFRVQEVEALAGEIAPDRRLDPGQGLVKGAKARLDPARPVEEVAHRGGQGRGADRNQQLVGAAAHGEHPGQDRPHDLGIPRGEGILGEERGQVVPLQGQQLDDRPDVLFADLDQRLAHELDRARLVHHIDAAAPFAELASTEDRRTPGHRTTAASERA